jgi:ElaA protein
MYTMLKLRQDVFIVEQHCPYHDIDELDRIALHVLGWQTFGSEKEELVAYLRLVPPGKKYKEPSIGRVITRFTHRRKGLGLELMRVALDSSRQHFPGEGNRISAQAHLEGFYSGLGYQVVSEPYDEDGIPHLEMLLTA